MQTLITDNKPHFVSHHRTLESVRLEISTTTVTVHVVSFKCHLLTPYHGGHMVHAYYADNFADKGGYGPPNVISSYHGLSIVLHTTLRI